jgi:hypothetical protein
VVPRQKDFIPTPWARCTVDLVYDGLRFANGVLPHRRIESCTEGASSTMGVGKVSKCGIMYDSR